MVADLVTWIRAGVKLPWPNKGDVPSPPLHWNSMEELQDIIRELGMRHVIYPDNFMGPDEE